MARIGLVGFFGWGNYGDELFLQNWRNTVGRHHTVSVVHELMEPPYFSRSAREVSQEYDAFVIGGGDLVIPNKISPLYWNRAWLDKPVYVSGVGVPTWLEHQADDVIEQLRQFFQHPSVEHIGARDLESAQWIRRNLSPNIPVETHADLVFNMVIPPAVKYEKPTVGINFRTHRAGANPAQLLAVCDAMRYHGYDVVNIVLGTGKTRKADLEVARAFPFADQILLDSEDVDELSSYLGGLDLLLSNKFHGTVVASMYGVSSVVLSSTTKSKNLYKTLDREALLSSNEDPQLLGKVQLARMPVSMRAVNELCADANNAVRRLTTKINQKFPHKTPVTFK